MLTPQLSQSVPTSSSSVRLPSNGMQGILSQNEEGPKIVVEEEPEEVRRALSQLVDTLRACSMGSACDIDDSCGVVLSNGACCISLHPLVLYYSTIARATNLKALERPSEVGPARPAPPSG